MVTGDGGLGTVLLGFDDTAYSWLAAEWAATEADRRGCALKVVHSVGRSADAAYGETGMGLTEQVLEGAVGVLDDARARLGAAHPGVPIDTALARDEPADALVTAAQDAGLVVVGTRGRGGFAGLLLGSVSLKVAAHADRPVVVVRGDTAKAAHKSIVVGVRDGRDEEAVRFALAEAELRQAGVRLVHAWAPRVYSGRMMPQATNLDEERHAHAELLNHAARPAAEYPNVHLDTELFVDSPAAALVQASARADLVVIPRHPAEGRFGLRLGSVVHAVLHHASCPVAVVPAGRTAAADDSAVETTAP
ncbi:universal stress protein [Streptomyces sp. NL15-2K]|uniref:universal stress protein n=1 Tax=Streptomyces sp. NL15-2K TaxID=376149 RepID=UPI000F55C48F|nr:MULTISPECIES: universal stress protein [Actinomycetes]WKX06472.1 universal stress protein [Kutzneria buriramensis]